MNEKVEITISTNDMFDVLALLYVRGQDLSGTAPEDVFRMFKDAKQRMVAESKTMRKEKSDRNLHSV